MSIRDNDNATTPVSTEFRPTSPSSERDLVIGDHVVFWNHLPTTRSRSRRPARGGWRSAGRQGRHRRGSRGPRRAHRQPGAACPKQAVHQELMNAPTRMRSRRSNWPRASTATTGAAAQFRAGVPAGGVHRGRWWIKEITATRTARAVRCASLLARRPRDRRPAQPGRPDAPELRTARYSRSDWPRAAERDARAPARSQGSRPQPAQQSSTGRGSSGRSVLVVRPLSIVQGRVHRRQPPAVPRKNSILPAFVVGAEHRRATLSQGRSRIEMFRRNKAHGACSTSSWSMRNQKSRFASIRK